MPKNRCFFAYGILLAPGAMAAKAPQARCLGPARLQGWRLAFFGRSAEWGGGCASLVQEAGSSAWGMLYELDPGQAERLDGHEDARMDGTGAYFHMPIEAEQGASKVAAVTYLKATCGPEQSPSTEALAKICEGAALAGLPEDYALLLKGLASVPAGFKAPKLALSFRPVSVGEGHCGGCGTD